MELIYRGAEADVYSGDWCARPAIYKLRRPLAYRLPELDTMIRSQRTAHEALMLRESKLAGVAAPTVYYLSPREAIIVMELIEGTRLKAILVEGGKTLKHMKGLAAGFGKAVATLHRAGIMHGDLTTSNVVVEGDKLSLIDFGLAIHSKRLEDQAVDLRLIKETLTGAHSTIARQFMQAFMSGYSSVLGSKRSDAALKKLAEIERRGRYARVE